MTYEEALRAINDRLVFGVKPGLERIQALCEKLGNPQKRTRFIHVAGTNGKGTTCTLIASVLQAAGFRTGLYTSPYVLDFRERFRIDGEMIPKAELAEEVERIAPLAAELEAQGETVTEFEFITALAFDWFARRACDFVVLEVGLGGRFDATNVIDTPEAAAVVSISLDHTAVLGDTLEKIAYEKAGIVKPGGSVVLYPVQDEAVTRTFSTLCAARGAKLFIADESRVEVGETTLAGTAVIWDGLPLTTPFTGAHQVHNAATALTVLDVLRKKGVRIPDEALQKGFSSAYIPARMERLSEKPLVLLDGGHNPGCAAALHEVLTTHLSGRKITAVMGIMSDKDSMNYLKLTAPHFSRIVTVAPQTPRALSAEALAEEAAAFCTDVIPASSMEEALRLSAVQDGEVLVICGSFFLASEIRALAIERYTK
ncbi:MAG: bifunctional folylpolyglutamate synthase/dihydrofolate synthase [Hominenteromicrobium sp.]